MTDESARRTSPMAPELVNDLSAQMLDIAQDVFRGDLTAMIVKGSAIKGDFIPHYSDFDVHIFARDGLVRWSGWVDTVLARIIDKPDAQLADNVRLTRTIMKAALYEAAIVLGDTPQQTWYRPLAEILDMVEPDQLPERPASRYFERAHRWADVRQDGSALRSMLADSISALDGLSQIPDEPRPPAQQ